MIQNKNWAIYGLHPKHRFAIFLEVVRVAQTKNWAKIGTFDFVFHFEKILCVFYAQKSLVFSGNYSIFATFSGIYLHTADS